MAKIVSNDSNISSIGSIAIAATGSTALYVDNIAILNITSSKVGIGTSTLNSTLHVNSKNANDSSLLLEKSGTLPTFTVTPWTNQIYIGAGTYYKNSVWTTQNNGSLNYQLLSLYPSVGVTWFANGASSNPATDTITLWNDSGSWVSKINSSNITGSLLGTSSYASTALSASYAPSSPSISASYASTASYATTSSYVNYIVITGTGSVSFPTYDKSEENFAITTISSSYIYNNNINSTYIIPRTSSNHDSLDDVYADGIILGITNIRDGISFDVVANAINNSWGIYNFFYKITQNN